MTDSSALLALIEKLEKSAAGSRELDALIKYEIIGLCGCGALCSPYYTTSIDHALMLVPEHFHTVKICMSQNKAPQRRFCHATLEQDADSLGRDMEACEPFEVEAENAASGPLAICIAALKARAQ